MKKRFVLALMAVVGALSLSIGDMVVQCKELTDRFSESDTEESVGFIDPRYKLVQIPDTHGSCAGISLAIAEAFSKADAESGEVVKMRKMFTSFVTGFDTWCQRADQLDITALHTVSKDGTMEFLSDTNIQTDNRTKVSHMSTTRVDYRVNMWYNVADNAYFVQMLSEDNDTNWVFLTDEVPGDMLQFYSALGGYNTTINTMSNIMCYMVEKLNSIKNNPLNSVKFGPREDQWSMSYVSGDIDIPGLSMTFGTPVEDLETFRLDIQCIDDCLYLDVVYVYKEDRAVEEETYSYILRVTDTYNMQPPSDVLAAPDTVEHLCDVYNNVVKGD